MRTAKATQAVEVDRPAMLTLMAQIPEMSDIIISVFAARRRRQLDQGDGSLRLIGEDLDPAVHKVAEFASRNRIPYQSLSICSPEAEAIATSCGVDARSPAVIFGKDHVVENPTPLALARLLGLNLEFDDTEQVHVLIVGGGPAGVAAAVYAGAEGLRALVVEDIPVAAKYPSRHH